MTIYDLYELLRCPKRYELNQIILSKECKQQLIFEETVSLFCMDFRKKTEWKYVEKKIKDKLIVEYKDEWFFVEWQKRKVVKEQVAYFRRLYYWLLTNIKDVRDCNVYFCYDYKDEIYDHSISEVDVKADLIIQKADGSLAGIMIVPEFLINKKRGKNSVSSFVQRNPELLMMLSCINKKYQGCEVSAMMLALKSKEDKDAMLAIYDEHIEELRIEISMQDFQSCMKEEMDDVIASELVKCRIFSCKQCDYKEVCKPSGRIHFRRNEKKVCFDDFPYTEKQKEAIQCVNGPVRVSAGPGAGKTATLVARIQYLLESGVPAKKILAVTFTKKAAKEIQGRISNNGGLFIMTLHALGFMIIRMNECWVGRKKLASKVDCKRILHELLKKLPELQRTNYEQMTGKHGFLERILQDFSYIDRNGENKFAETYPQKDMEGINRVKELYEHRYRYAGFISYGEQISYAVEILENHASARKCIQDMFDYILIDEAQDLDENQVRLVKLLVKEPECNLTVFGDTDQSIYGFRGGSNRFMVEFKDIFPNAKDFHLDDNFRSSGEILRATNCFIGHNKERVPFAMRPHFETGTKPILLQKFCMEHFGTFINSLLRKGVRLGDIAIIARTNKDLESLCHMIDAYNKHHPDAAMLKYEKPKYYLYEDFTFQTIFDLLAIHQGNYRDDMIWFRLLGGTGVQLKKEDVSMNLYDNWLNFKKIYPLDKEERTRYLSVTDEDTALLQAIAKIYRATQLFQLAPREAIRQICESYFAEEIDYEETLQLLDDMLKERFIKSAFEMYRFFSAIKVYQDDTRVTYGSERSEQLHLLTAHDSKGKEFPVVMVYGVDEFDGGGVEEDRRLLYVAMTRAKTQLFLTEICDGKSMFLREMEGLIDVKGGIDFEKNASVWG